MLLCLDVYMYKHDWNLSLCLLISVLDKVYLLLLGQLSPKNKRSSKQVHDGMFIPVFLEPVQILTCEISLLQFISFIQLWPSGHIRSQKCLNSYNVESWSNTPTAASCTVLIAIWIIVPNVIPTRSRELSSNCLGGQIWLFIPKHRHPCILMA